jgi:hypothetical protein
MTKRGAWRVLAQGFSYFVRNFPYKRFGNPVKTSNFITLPNPYQMSTDCSFPWQILLPLPTRRHKFPFENHRRVIDNYGKKFSGKFSVDVVARILYFYALKVWCVIGSAGGQSYEELCCLGCRFYSAVHWLT